MDNGPQFDSKFFVSFCDSIRVKHLTATAYHLHKDDQAERMNRTMVTRPRHQVSVHQQAWNVCVQPLTYEYNMQVYRRTNNSLYSLVQSQQPPGPSLLSATSEKTPSATYNHLTQLIPKLQHKRIVALRPKEDANMRES